MSPGGSAAQHGPQRRELQGELAQEPRVTELCCCVGFPLALSVLVLSFRGSSAETSFFLWLCEIKMFGEKKKTAGVWVRRFVLCVARSSARAHHVGLLSRLFGKSTRRCLWALFPRSLEGKMNPPSQHRCLRTAMAELSTPWPASKHERMNPLERPFAKTSPSPSTGPPCVFG